MDSTSAAPERVDYMCDRCGIWYTAYPEHKPYGVCWDCMNAMLEAEEQETG